VNRRATDRPGQDRGRRLPFDRGDAADLAPLAAAVRRHASRGGQEADSAGEGERQALAEGFSEGVKASGGGRTGEGDALARRASAQQWGLAEGNF
jgi:hypothetical protein